MISSRTSRRSGARRMIAASAGLAALASAFLAATQSAQAQTQRGLRAPPPPVVIQRRSFLDPGKVVPLGSMHNYVGMDTVLRQLVYSNQRGFENLPRRFDPPGRPQPLFEF